MRPPIRAITARLRPPDSRVVPVRAAAPLVTPVAPAGPSCSRWLSCSCCRSAAPRPRPAASSASDSRHANTRQHSPSAHPLAPERDHARARPPSFATVQQPPARTPHLPLPPPLPYSPTSVPFQRHLQALSLSLLSTPDDSWAIYHALHASLRPSVPDATFASLFDHQLRARLPARWDRVRELAALAQDCGMRPARLGAPALERALVRGLEEAARMAPAGPAWLGTQAALRWLWAGLGDALGGDLAAIGTDARRLWVRQYLRADTPRRHRQAARALDTLVERGAAHGLELVMRDVALLAGENSDDLRRATRYIALGARLSDGDIVQLVNHAYSVSGNDIGAVQVAVAVSIDALRARGLDQAAESFEAALEKLRHSVRNPEDRAGLLLRQSDASIGQLTRAARAVLKGPDANVELALQLAEAAVARDADADNVVSAVASRLVLPAHIVRLAAAAADPARVASLSPAVLCDLFDRLVATLPDPSAYPVARRLYATVRAAEPTYTWARDNTSLWRRLLHTALAHQHLHFASRLYADVLADGRAVSQADALALIRAIGAHDRASRAVLLDRHVKDYRWAGHDDGALCVALADGLARTARGAALALDLVTRIAAGSGSAAPEPALAAIARRLAASPRPEHGAAALGLVDGLAPDSARAALEARLAVLVKARHPPAAFDLAPAVGVYRGMAARGLAPSARTVSLLVHALLRAKQTGPALRVFHTALDAGLAVRSDAAGRLMVGLELADRPDDADDVERQWRASRVSGAPLASGNGEAASSNPDGEARPRARARHTWTKGVDGARVILDVRRGRAVDVAAVERRTGWRASPTTRRWIDAMRAEYGERGRVRADAASAAAAADAGVADCAAEAGRPDTAPRDDRACARAAPPRPARTPARPLTRSLEDDGHRWLLDGGEEGEMAYRT